MPTYAEYVAFENASAEKHEFIDGEIHARAGGTEEHSALSAMMVWFLGNAVVGRPCRVHTSDLRIYVESAGMATYPDASVICAAAPTPVILVEVTSDSSEEYDTGAKLEYYQTIPTLREYVIVSHRERRITVHARGTDARWTTQHAVGGGEVMIPSLDAQLSVDEVYRDSAIS